MGKLVQDNPNLRFLEEFANPHSWLLTAENLHEQAVLLRKRRDGGVLIKSSADGRRRIWDRTNKTVFLLGGFALENAIKAFLVYENPEWISGGQLSRKLRSHNLTTLQDQSSTIPYKKKMRWVLAGFEEGLDTWARYPCGLTFARSQEEVAMEPRLWSGYERLMTAYIGRLQNLLSSKLWHGPHGFAGKWSFQDFP